MEPVERCGLEVVEAGGVAAEAGLEPGDLVVHISGGPVYEIADLWLLESTLPAGEVSFDYFRGTERRTGRSSLGLLEGSRA